MKYIWLLLLIPIVIGIIMIYFRDLYTGEVNNLSLRPSNKKFFSIIVVAIILLAIWSRLDEKYNEAYVDKKLIWAELLQTTGVGCDMLHCVEIDQLKPEEIVPVIGACLSNEVLDCANYLLDKHPHLRGQDFAQILPSSVKDANPTALAKLIARGVPINAEAVTYAMLTKNREKRLKIMTILADAKAPINMIAQPTSHNTAYTPLQIAAEEDDAPLASMLLAHGADASITTKRGYTARMIAIGQDSKAVLKVLPNPP